MKIKLLIAILILYFPSVFAESFISADIGAGFAAIETSDRLKVNDTKKISSLGSADDYNTSLRYVPFGEIKAGAVPYFFLYGSVSIQESPRIEYGLKFQGSPNTMVSFYSFKPLDSKVWKDPYLTGADREETDIKKLGYGFTLKIPNFYYLKVETEKIGVAEDESGRNYEALKRDGRDSYVETGFTFSTAKSFNEKKYLTFIPSYYSITSDREGNALDYSGSGVKLKFRLKADDYLFGASYVWGINDYVAENPIFTKERLDFIDGYNIYVRKQGLSDMKNMFWMVSAGYKKKESNIDFYESTDKYTMMSIGISF